MSAGADVLPDIAGVLVDRRDLARTQSSVLEGLFGTPREPTCIGRFELLGTVGSGAMGRVYAARDPRLDRRVAIKLLRPDIAAGPLAVARRRRLVAEAQALARLSHPHVVEVFEVGTEGAEVYVVMELVDGASLRQWLDDAQPEPATIVETFVAAGRGLAAAHAAGIVHRDFKPDNVLIGDDGRVRVADFGVAIASAEDASAGSPSSPRTGTGGSQTIRGAAGTPGYVAPEVLRDGLADARSDQFSFCVSLVEALTGRRPRGPDDVPALPLSAGSNAAIRRGLHDDPNGRHDSIDALLEALAGTSRWRRRTMALAGGLVVLGGTAWAGQIAPSSAAPQCRPIETLVDPVWNDARRRSVRAALRLDDEALGEQAWSRGEPVIDAFVAGVSSRREAACDRGPSPEAVEAADACAIATLTELDAVIGAFERREVAAQHLVPALDRMADTTGCEGAPERGALRAELLRAEALVSAGDDRGPALALQVRQQADDLADRRTAIEADLAIARAEIRDDETDRGVERLRSAYFVAVESADDPLAARAALMMAHHAIAYEADAAEARRWGEYAESHVRRIDDPNVRRERAIQVEALWAKLALETRDPAEALTRIEAAQMMLHRHPRPEPELGTRLLRLRGQAQLQRGRLDEALLTLEAAVERNETHFGSAHPTTLGSVSNVGTLLFRLGRYDEARERLLQVTAGLSAAFGPDDARVATNLTALGACQGKLGELDAARDTLLRAHEILHAELGEDHDRVALNLLNLSEVDSQLGDLEAAIRHREQAVTIQRRLFGEDSPRMVPHYNGLGQLYTSAGRYEQAVAAHRHVLAIAEGPAELAPQPIISAHLGLSRARSEHDIDVAIGHLQTALPLIADSVGTRHEDYAIALTNLAALEVLAGRPEDALAPAVEAVAIYEHILGPDHPDVAYALLAAADAEVAHRAAGDAIAHAERAVTIRLRHERVPDYLLARAQLVLVRALWLDPARRDEALALVGQARTTLQAAGEDGVPGLEELAAWEASR